jgi:lipopolysaccharide/colanic/teichoic acid biosynthesis glycosyltransferase
VTHLSRARTAIGRVAEVIAALCALLIALPAVVLIAIAIRIDTAGPIFYSQIRLGRNGRRFRLYKFRKFGRWAEGSWQAVTLRDDPRMTRVGRILERTKLDELPQFWNIVIGDMAFVGPRPETENFADCFTGPFQRVLDHVPGLFGPTQVLFRNEGAMFPKDCDPHDFYRGVLFPAKARIDLSYYPQRTLASDIAWILRSIFALLSFSSPANETACMEPCLLRDQSPQAASSHRAEWN